MRALLEQDVALNTYLLGVLERPRTRSGSIADDGRFYGAPSANSLTAIIYVSHTGLVVPYCQDGAALETLAAAVWPRTLRKEPAGPAVRLCVGPEDGVAVVVRATRGVFTPRVDRPQQLLELARDQLTPCEGAAVELAVDADVSELVPLLASMQEEELGIEAHRFETPGFRARIRSIVSEGRAFVTRDAGRIVFHVSANAVSRYGAQLEAVYTAKSHRRAGVATRSLTAAASQLLTTLPRLVLGVAEENVPAIRLYRRVGFVPTARLRLAAA